jgi:hypothetical protein
MADDGDSGAGDAAFEAALTAREQGVDALLRANRASDALKAALQDAPLASKNAALKDRNAAVVQRALVACMDAALEEIKAAVHINLDDLTRTAALFAMLRTAFASRRKMLRKTLAASAQGASGDAVAAALAATGASPDARPQELSLHLA